MENETDKIHSQDYLGEARDYWWNDDYLELLAKRLKLDSCDTIADVGCGKGYMCFKLARYLKPNAKVYGLDMESEWIEEAKNKLKNMPNPNNINFEFIEGDAHKIPLHDSLADMTFCQTLLMHVKNPLQVIKEMKRITKPGGSIVAMEPNNIINFLFHNSLSNITDDIDIEQTMEKMEINLRIEKGKKLMGLGFHSLGDVVPELFIRTGLKDIKVWIADKALAVIPPYNSHEMKSRAAELVNWIKTGKVIFGYEENLKYYLAGGGEKEKFDSYWEKLNKKNQIILESIEKEEYIDAGGGVMYIVAAKV